MARGAELLDKLNCIRVIGHKPNVDPMAGGSGYRNAKAQRVSAVSEVSRAHASERAKSGPAICVPSELVKDRSGCGLCFHLSGSFLAPRPSATPLYIHHIGRGRKNRSRNIRETFNVPILQRRKILRSSPSRGYNPSPCAWRVECASSGPSQTVERSRSEHAGARSSLRAPALFVQHGRAAFVCDRLGATWRNRLCSGFGS